VETVNRRDVPKLWFAAGILAGAAWANVVMWLVG
jgi:hypothetical protein